MRAQLPAHRYTAIRDIHSLKAYMDEAPNTLLFVRCGSRSHKPKLSAEPCGTGKGKYPPLAMENATRSFCILMLGFLDDYVGSTDPAVLQAVNFVQKLCELPLPGQPVSVIGISPQLYDAVEVLHLAALAPAARPPQRAPTHAPVAAQVPSQPQVPQWDPQSQSFPLTLDQYNAYNFQLYNACFGDTGHSPQ